MVADQPIVFNVRTTIVYFRQMTRREIPDDILKLAEQTGAAPRVVVPSAIGLPEPSGLTATEWDKQTEELLTALAAADEDAERLSSTRADVLVKNRA